MLSAIAKADEKAAIDETAQILGITGDSKLESIAQGYLRSVLGASVSR